MTKLTSDNQLSDLSSLLEKMRQTYLVEYAYPTSSLAKKLGFEREGCWYVSALVDGKTTNPRRVVTKGIAEKIVAQQICDDLTRRKSLKSDSPTE
jgi:hypothetical protein